MKKIVYSVILFALFVSLFPKLTFAASGIFPSGGGNHNIGETFTVTVTASGGEFNAFQGKISVSGPVNVVSFSSGNANWITQPSNGGTFSGALLGQKSSSLTIATIKLKGTSVGNGGVTVSGVILKNGTETVSNSGGTASYSIQKAPELPGSINVTSTSHPDQAQAYEASTISLAWNKGGNVTGFSYLLDQNSGTTPPSTTMNANTSVSYEKPVGVYYFHIKGQSTDGWGPTTHYKITIKEPDPKVKSGLTKPSNFKVEKASPYENDIIKGTLSGVKISGTTEPNYSANIKLDPSPSLPEGKTLSAKPDENGNFELVIDFPIKSGHYTMTVQGQNDKVLTPISDPFYFEVTQAKGGSVKILSEADLKEVTPQTPKQEEPKKWYEKIDYKILSAIFFGLLIHMAISLVFLLKQNRGGRSLIKHLRPNN
jgi:hypothetical protein